MKPHKLLAGLGVGSTGHHFCSLAQEYIVDGSNRTAVGTQMNFPLVQGGGAFGAAADDYSFYGCRNYFLPYGEGGKHEIECYASAASPSFDPDPIVTAAASARYTGQCPGDLNVESNYGGGSPCTIVHGHHCAWACCAAGLLASGALQRPAWVHLVAVQRIVKQLERPRHRP